MKRLVQLIDDSPYENEQRFKFLDAQAYPQIHKTVSCECGNALHKHSGAYVKCSICGATIGKSVRVHLSPAVAASAHRAAMEIKQELGIDG